jgi:alpha-amylase
MKWHADWIRKFGFDGFRVDTVKHVEASVWKEFKQIASDAFEVWKKNNPKKKISDDAFFMTAEAYNYSIETGLQFPVDGGGQVNYYDHGFDSMINFGFKSDAKQSYEALFSSYSEKLNGELRSVSVLNYVSSHDDGQPFDAQRLRPFESANKLLLSPGAAQIYYGDELARDLHISGATGDANLRSFMNWDELKNNTVKHDYQVAQVLSHWRKLGQFRKAHIAVGAGKHQMRMAASPLSPYVFSREYAKEGVQDRVLVALDLPQAEVISISVFGLFAEGAQLIDYYSGQSVVVTGGKVEFKRHSTSKHEILLIAERKK